MNSKKAFEDTSLYEVPTKLIEYSESYVAFVDVLGFREIVQEDAPKKVSVYYSIIDESIAKLTEILSIYGAFNAQIMSDSIIFSITPKSKPDKLECLRALCAAVSHLQFYLSLESIWSRGGLTYGKIAFHENRFVVGPALVTAVELEKISKFPRVILDPRILRDFGWNREQFLKHLHPTERPDVVGIQWVYEANVDDSDHFTDFLFLNFGVHLLQNQFRYAVQSAEKVASNLRAGIYGSPIHLAKYQWMLSYFLKLQLDEKSRKFFLEV